MRACESIRSRERQADETDGVAQRGMGPDAKLKGDARRTRRRMCFESKTGGRKGGGKGRGGWLSALGRYVGR